MQNIWYFEIIFLYRRNFSFQFVFIHNLSIIVCEGGVEEQKFLIVFQYFLYNLIQGLGRSGEYALI